VLVATGIHPYMLSIIAMPSTVVTIIDPPPPVIVPVTCPSVPMPPLPPAGPAPAPIIIVIVLVVRCITIVTLLQTGREDVVVGALATVFADVDCARSAGTVVVAVLELLVEGGFEESEEIPLPELATLERLEEGDAEGGKDVPNELVVLLVVELDTGGGATTLTTSGGLLFGDTLVFPSASS